MQMLEKATSILDQHTLSMAQGDVNWTIPYESLGELLREKVGYFGSRWKGPHSWCTVRFR